MAVSSNSIVGGDAALAREMPVACEQLTAASHLFRLAAQQLKTNPIDVEARRTLVNATRGILAGTTSVLATYDALEIRKIVVYGEQLMGILNAMSEIAALEQLVPLVRSLSQVISNVVALANARREELVNAVQRDAVSAGTELLSKASPLLVSALRTFIENPTNLQAQASRNFALEQVHKPPLFGTLTSHINTHVHTILRQ